MLLIGLLTLVLVTAGHAAGCSRARGGGHGGVASRRRAADDSRDFKIQDATAIRRHRK